MTPGAYNLTIRPGVAFAITFAFTEDDGTTPIDLTGWTAHAHVRKLPTSALVKDLAPAVSDGPGGVVAIEFTDEDTAAFTPGNFRWDLILENPSGSRLGPYLSGLCAITLPITQPAP